MSAVPVRIVCGACGSPVSPGDRVCPACGTALEFPAGERVCPSCGHRNAPGDQTCRSCGGALRDSPPRGRERKEERARKKPAGKNRVEPWIVVAGIAVLALLAAIVVLERPSASPPAAGPSTAVAPAAPEAAVGGGDHIARLEEAVRGRPGDGQALLDLANALHDHREWARAIEVYGQYLQKKPDDPDARVDRGICYFELSRVKGEKGEEDFARAVKEMEEALRKSPNHVPAAFNLGAIYLQRGALRESNEWFRRAVAIDKNHPLAQRAQRMLDQHAFGN